MVMENITLSIPKDLPRKVERIAAARQTSVPDLVCQILQSLVQQEDAYAHARRRHLQRLEQGTDLGTGGQVLTHRDELH